MNFLANLYLRISRPGTLLKIKEPSCLWLILWQYPSFNFHLPALLWTQDSGFAKMHIIKFTHSFTGAFSWAQWVIDFLWGKSRRQNILPHILNTNTCFQPSLGPLKTVWFSSYQAPILWYKIPLGLPLVSYPFSLFQVAPHKWRKTTLNYCQTHSVLSEMLSKHINVNPSAFNHF